MQNSYTENEKRGFRFNCKKYHEISFLNDIYAASKSLTSQKSVICIIVCSTCTKVVIKI